MPYEESKCPICEKVTQEEYCNDCTEMVSLSVGRLKDALDTDWEQVLDLLRYYYERNY